MSEVLRIETQMLERARLDFLGSVSHEMKSPLHQALGNLELLLQTSCSDGQYDFAVHARFGATQLLETIDKILLYSSISSDQRDLAEFQQECGAEFADVKKVVICAAIGKNSAQDRERIRQAATVADSLITDKSETLDAAEKAEESRQERRECSSHNNPKKPDSESKDLKQADDQTPAPDNRNNPGQATVAGSEKENVPGVESQVSAVSEDDGAVDKLLRISSNSVQDARKTVMERNLTAPILQGSAQPHLLSVDDNSVNLEMLGMFVSKSGIPAAHSTSVTGGPEAIEAYKSFESKNSTTLGFDIVLINLSMPEVSSFEATSTIREIENASDVDRKANIVALTGLASDKDRSAAHEAGVDDYVTKPAGLQKAHGIIEAWQKRKYDFAG
ncbi:hypothetical protein MBLNU13_g06560t1 [Cladosporium sp. NU13]